MRLLIDFGEVKRRISVYDVLHLHHWTPTLSRRGCRRGPCPVHGSRSHRSRSLAVTATGYYCHVCHAHGDAPRLHAEITRQPIYAATIDLCALLGIEVPWIRQTPDPRNRKRNGQE